VSVKDLIPNQLFGITVVCDLVGSRCENNVLLPTLTDRGARRVPFGWPQAFHLRQPVPSGSRIRDLTPVEGDPRGTHPRMRAHESYV
jgi:hypothetical protein